MHPSLTQTCTAFAGHEMIAAGPVAEVALAVKKRQRVDPNLTVLVFDDESSAQVEIDWRGTADEVVARLRTQDAEGAENKSSGPGRPKLGVVAREVTLLPRHWEWLAVQRGGASATLRRLIEEARKNDGGAELRRKAQDAAYKFMTALAGNLPRYEEALRAFFAGEQAAFEKAVAAWPRDVKEHAVKLATRAFTVA